MELSDNNAENISRPIFENIHRAYAEENYPLLLKNFSNKMKEDLTENVFIEALEKYYRTYGQLIELQYLGHLEKNIGHQTLWKGRYSESSEEILWHLYLSEDNGELEVIGLWFGY